MNESTEERSARKAVEDRLAASFLDCFVIFLCLPVTTPVGRLCDAVSLPWWGGLIMALLAWIAASVAVLAAFESSKLRATPGKLACGLVVTLADGGRVGFRRAFIRNLIKWGLIMPSIVRFQVTGWDKGGSFHDSMTGTIVVGRREASA